MVSALSGNGSMSWQAWRMQRKAAKARMSIRDDDAALLEWIAHNVSTPCSSWYIADVVCLSMKDRGRAEHACAAALQGEWPALESSFDPNEDCIKLSYAYEAEGPRRCMLFVILSPQDLYGASQIVEVHSCPTLVPTNAVERAVSLRDLGFDDEAETAAN